MFLLRKGFPNFSAFTSAPRLSRNYSRISGTSTVPRIATATDATKRIVWVDLEMTGLDIEKDHIIEIGCLITDAELNIVACCHNIVIHLPNEILNNMNDWCIRHHGESGLTELSRKSNLCLADAEKCVLDFVKKYVPEKSCPLAGNSVYCDRLFLYKYMPKLNQYLHYSIIDVSTIKELSKRWYQNEYSKMPVKKCAHRALDGIRYSVEELKYFKCSVFKT